MFWTFLVFTGAFCLLFLFMGVFWSYLSNREYFGLFQAQGVLWSFSMFWGVFRSFLGFEGVLVFF